MLLYKQPLGETAEQRLTMMEDTEDGFLIAEKDLELRGGGEMLGARQSGTPGFRVAEVPGFEMLLTAARDDAKLVLANDPDLDVAARASAADPALSLRMRRSCAPVPGRLDLLACRLVRTASRVAPPVSLSAC